MRKLALSSVLVVLIIAVAMVGTATAAPTGPSPSGEHGYYTVTIRDTQTGVVEYQKRFNSLAAIHVRLPASSSAASSSWCWNKTGTIKYNDFFHDIYSISETANWCANGTGGFLSYSWSRSWNRYDLLYNWCGWKAKTNTTGGNFSIGGWARQYSKGCFHSIIPPIDWYPTITMTIYPDGTKTVTGSPY